MSTGPSVYVMDPFIERDPKAIMYSSLLGGFSRVGVHADKIDLESELRGQSSKIQPYCPVGVEMPWRDNFMGADTGCADLPKPAPASGTPNGNAQSNWLDRNMSTSKCGPSRM